jgi:signal peptide peptidase SppA
MTRQTQTPANVQLPQSLLSHPWALDRSRLGAVCEQLMIRGAAMARMDVPAIEAAVMAAALSPLGRVVGSVAVIPITGCITQKADFYSWWFGGTSVERVTAAFRQYLHDPAVSTIVFDIDSPGGEVYGVPECAEEIFAARGTKKTIAVSNPFCASAAYWLASACDEVVLLPSGQAGSVGVYTLHEDLSKMLERVGVAITFVQYGEHKTEGNPYEPLVDAAREEMQASVDYYGRLFDAAVAKGRGLSAGDVKANFGQGRVLRAPEAKKAGMVDRVATLDEVLAKLQSKQMRRMAATSGAPAPSAESETLPIVAAEETVEPNEDGSCPDGYEKGDDGQCRLIADEATRAAAAQLQADQDAIAVTLALTE